MNLEQIEAAKERLKSLLAKGILKSPEELAWSEEDGPGLKGYIRSWYERIYHFNFVEEQVFEEQIFHSPGHIQITCGDRRLFDGMDLTQDDFQLALEIICLKNSVTWNYSRPFVSFDLQLRKRKFRASLLHHSLCKEHGSKLFLRSCAPAAFDIQLFHEDSNFWVSLVEEKKNVLVCGGTGSGKTSLLNALLVFSNKDEHIVMLEDTFELLSPHSNVTRLLARNGHSDDLKQFMSHTMRMSPDRIVIGELRSNEVEPYLLAMNSGHKGVLSSIHANNCVDALHRVALLMRLYSSHSLEYALVLKLICQNIDFVAHVENKKVVEIIEVFGSEANQVFYEKKAAKPAALQA